MKIVDVEQGTPEWHAVRCGRVTGSRVCDIVRKTKSGVSASRNTYMGELIGERMSGRVNIGFTSKAMEWGNATEDDARSYYGFMHDVEPIKVGFVLHPKIEMAGVSPDRLVGDNGLIEIKCPNTSTHIETLLGAAIDPDYIKQMQWQMACTGRDWCDFVSFDPRMPEHMQLFSKRIQRDAAMIVELETAVKVFISEIDEKISALRRAYPEPLSVAAE